MKNKCKLKNSTVIYNDLDTISQPSDAFTAPPYTQSNFKHCEFICRPATKEPILPMSEGDNTQHYSTPLRVGNFKCQAKKPSDL